MNVRCNEWSMRVWNIASSVELECTLKSWYILLLTKTNVPLSIGTLQIYRQRISTWNISSSMFHWS
jgi:hypothetical protein